MTRTEAAISVSLIVLFVAALSGCGEKFPDAVGVFIECDEGFVETRVAYEESRGTKFTRRRNETEPVSGFRGFLIRLPDAMITGTQAFIFDDPEDAERGQIDTDEYANHIVEIEMDISEVADGVYRVVPRLTKAQGTSKNFFEYGLRHVLIRVHMPMGSADRFYVAEIRDESWAQ